ncbi:MAG: CopG family transcriptional regulator [Acidimicrobiia bacterium]
MSVDTVTLKIPRPLYEHLQELIEGTGFRSPTEFVLFVLRDLAGAETQDLELVRNRLKTLGYL